MKRVYIAGPMRGIPEFNFPAFDTAAESVRFMGNEPVSPADIDRAAGIPKDPSGDATGIDLDPIIKRDIDALLTCDEMLLLPGWENSKGAVAEVAAAIWKGGFTFRTFPDFSVVPIDLVAKAMPTCRVIGFTGYAGAGKDEAADTLTAFGFKKLGFADPMYDIALVLNPWLFRFGILFRLSWAVRALGWTRAKKIPAVRRYLQTLGTEVGRTFFGESVWVDFLARRMRSGGKYTVTNVRYPNEAELIRRMGGHIIRIERPGTGPANGHSSEHQPIHADAVIFNAGTIRELRIQVAETVADLTPRTSC